MFYRDKKTPKIESVNKLVYYYDDGKIIAWNKIVKAQYNEI